MITTTRRVPPGPTPPSIACISRGFVLCLSLMLWASPGPQSITLGQNSRIEQGQIFSNALTNNLLGDSGARPFSAYLPPSYDSTQKRYPVVYALHGYGGSHTDLETLLQPVLDSMTATQVIGEMIMVFVSGTNRLGGCQYLSSPVIGDYETYIAKDLVGYIDAHYRTVPARNSRGITGMSMGGWGSMHLALKFPDVFGVVVPNAGYYDAVGGVAEYIWSLASQNPPTNLVQFDSLPFPLNWAQSMLAGLLPDPQRPALHIDYPFELIDGQLVPVATAQQRLRDGDVAHGDLGRYTNQPIRLNAIKIVHGTNDTVAPISMAHDFTNALSGAGVHFTYEEHPGGHAYVPELSLPFLSTNLGAEVYVGPLIAQQPQSRTNAAGTTATFTVIAAGREPLAYQWERILASGPAPLVSATDATLVLTNVEATDAGDYGVIVTNLDGAATSTVAHLTVLPPPRLPQITPTTLLQHQAVFIGTRASFTVTPSGTAPFAYQWRLDGHELENQTNRTLSFSAVQPADEGDYTVLVTNLAGAVTSAPVRLWVTPPESALIKTNFTTSLGRLPYFYLLPTSYDATRSYPLELLFHGGGDETTVTNYYNTFPAIRRLASYRQQERDPVIALWPSRRVGDGSWTAAYLSQTSALLDQFIARFNVDTNRVYVEGVSEGVHGAWDMIALRPGFFAGALLAAGWQGSSPPASVKDVPFWACVARDDSADQYVNTQQAVRALRLAGGNVRYSEYATGAYADNTGHSYVTHEAGIVMAWVTPQVAAWLLAQRRGGPSTAEPLLSITNLTTGGAWSTGARNLSLAGSALALDQNLTGVAWENTANNRTGAATGSNGWSIAGLPLALNRTNVVIVTATTTSWAPACGGNTTFSQTLMIACYPIRATLALQGNGALLNWSGGGPPYRLQRATDLVTGNWTDFLSNAVPPLTVPLDGASGFYRVLGQ